MNVSESPPGRAEASGSNAGHRENQILNTQLLPDRSFLGNCHRMIRSQPGSEVREVFTMRSHFELVSDSETWRFSSLWEAICEQVRLTQSPAAKERTP